MTTNRTGALQLVRYTPMGARLGVLPVHQLTHVSGPNGGALTVTISEVLYGELPDEVEVAVEQWSGSAFVEERDGRFTFTSQNVDKADVAGMVRITAQALVPWMGEGAFLAGVDPFRMDDLQVVAAKTLTGVSSSGSTLTKSGHGLFAGDRVRIEEIGKMSTKAVKSGGVYYVRNLTTNTFQLSAALTGDVIKAVGTSSGDVKLERLRDQVSAPGHPFKNGDAVRVAYADGSGLNDGSSYFIVRDGGVAFGFASEPGGAPIELNSNNLGVYRDLDGERVFKGAQATPGYIIEKAFSEAQARNGWGAALSEDFSGTVDSAGVGWVDLLEGEAGLPIGFRPGTTLTAMLNFLVENQYAEFTSLGRTLRLYNYGWGVDRSLGNTPVTLGRAATAKPAKKDLNNVASHIRVRGEGRVQVDVSGTPGAFGPREMYVNASGVTSTKLAASVGSQKLKVAKVLTQNAVTENAAEARWLAGRDYFRGDYLLALVSRTSGDPDRFRVVEIHKSMDDKQNVEVTTIFGDRIVSSPLARLAARARQQSGGISSGGNGAGIPVVDRRKPAAPVLNQPESTGAFSATGAAVSSIVGTWSGVTTDIDGLDIYVTQYEMWLRADGKVQGYPAATTGGLIASAEAGAPGQVFLVSVRAQSSTGVWGPFSDELEVETKAPLEPPNPPTPPTVTSLKGVATVSWNGLLVDPLTGLEDPELGFSHVDFDRAPDVAGTPGTWAPLGGNLGRAGEHTDANVEVGATYWWRAVAVTTVGVASAPSAAFQHTVVGVSDADLDPSFLATFTDGKNAVTFATVDPPNPDPDAGTRTVDDLWFKRLGTVATGLWAWDGDSWEPRTLDNAVLGTLDVAKLVAGAATIDTAVVNKMVAQVLSAGRINSQMISVGTRLPSATPMQRVPAPPTDLAFWAQVLAGTIVFTRWSGDTIGNRNVTAGTGGLVLTPTALLDARLYVMQRTVVPLSRKVNTMWLQSGSAAGLVLVWFDAAGTATEVTLTKGATYEFPTSAVEYTVRLHSPAAAAAETVAVLQVFEAIGNVTGGQFTEMTPGGFKMGNSDGSLVIDLTANSPQVFSLSKQTSPGIWDQTMSIDTDGNLAATSLSSGSTLHVAGTDIIGRMDTAALYEGAVGQLPLLERIGWGEAYTRTFTYPTSIATQDICVAEGVFSAVEGRQYEFVVNVGKVEVTNPTNQNIRLELLIGPDPLSVTTAATTWTQTHWLIQNQSQALPVASLRAELKCVASAIDLFSEVTPGSVYWMLRFHAPAAFTGGPATVTTGASTGNRFLTIRDAGPVRSTASATSGATSGTQATTAPRRVDVVDCIWSANWLASGAKVTGSTAYDNARSLYSGSSSSGIRSSAVGFPALGLAGRTIIKAEIELQNRYVLNTPAHLYLGTATSTAEPASPPTRSNAGTTTFRRGEKKRVSLPSAAYAGLASGTIRAVTLGYVADSACYSYYDGFGQEGAPKLYITSEA